MNFNPMFENPFSKKNEADETLNDTFTQPEEFEKKEEETTIDQDIATIEEKKQEIEKLRNELESYKNNAFQLREKILGLGLTDAKKRDLYQKITDRSKEIAAAIREIKDEYGIEPTEIEVLSSRFANLTSKVDQLKENLQLKRKALQKDLKKFALRVREHGPHGITQSLEAGYGDIPTVAEITKAISSKGVSDREAVAETLNKYAEEVEKEIKDLVTYESPGEEQAALEKLDRLSYLADVTEMSLREAKEDPDSFR